MRVWNEKADIFLVRRTPMSAFLKGYLSYLTQPSLSRKNTVARKSGFGMTPLIWLMKVEFVMRCDETIYSSWSLRRTESVFQKQTKPSKIKLLEQTFVCMSGTKDKNPALFFMYSVSFQAYIFHSKSKTLCNHKKMQPTPKLRRHDEVFQIKSETERFLWQVLNEWSLILLSLIAQKQHKMSIVEKLSTSLFR